MKKKIIFISTIIIIIIILISTILFLYMKKNNKENNAENNTENSNVYDCFTYLIYNSDRGSNDGLVDSVNLIFAFNEKDICVDYRAIWNFNDEEIAKRSYNQWNEIYPNVEINSTKVSFNQKSGGVIGETKEEIRNNEYKSFDLVEY